MSELVEELKSLQKVQSSFSLFSKKTQTISRLKIDFFEKMKKFEQEENIEKAHQYFLYLIRTTNLSEKVYSRIREEINNNFKYIESASLIQIQSNQNQIIEQDLNKILSSLDIFVNSTKKLLNELNRENNPLQRINSIILNEKNLLQKIEYQPGKFFEELELQTQLHKLFQEEQQFSELIISKIKLFQSETQNLAQKLTSQITIFKRNAINLIQQLRQRPMQTLFAPFETTGIKLEKNASIFAATIFALSIISNVSTLLGIGAISATCKGLILLMAEIGEPLQAIPAIKNAVANFSNYIRQAVQKALTSMKSLELVNA